MSNFDFLKNFNNELYKLGMKLEEDVLESPRAVTADATLFLETLVKDIYKLSNTKLENRLISFYKKIDNLYRQGVITYIYKNKLQDAYNLRNKIHKNYQDSKEEISIALDLHKRLYYISKKYYKDFCETRKHTAIPEYKIPVKKDIKFNNCIICGCKNTQSSSNMCDECNKKIEDANLLLSLKNTYGKEKFKRSDLINAGISESESISLLMNMTRDNIITKNGQFYTFNKQNFENHMEKINKYIEIGLLLSKFYKDEMPAEEIKKTMEYWNGSKHQKPYLEFYKLVNDKIQKDFEQKLIDNENIKKSMKDTSTDDQILRDWFEHEKEAFISGSLNDAFILYNELLIKEYFNLKRRGLNDAEILKHLEISHQTYEFWQKQFMGQGFMKKTSNIKKDLILKEIRKNKTLNEALKSSGVSRKEFDKLYIISKNDDDDFHKTFDSEYTLKRQKTVLKHLKYNNLNSAIRKSKITKTEFLKWYYKSETALSGFYIEATSLLMNKYLHHRKNGFNKKDILKHINISRDMYDSWLKHDDLKLVRDFIKENGEITSHLIKRGLIINALKEDKSKEEAISNAGLTPKEFMEIYDASKKEKTEFHTRFDREYMENRKRLFAKLIKNNDFYNSIEKCQISQIDFNKWFLKDQDIYLSDYRATDFYLTVTRELMCKYIKARLNGANKPDAARSVGLSNMIISKWLNHPEYNLYYEFTKHIKQLSINLVVKGFNEGKSKYEVSEAYDISIKNINEFINLGRNGFIKYEEIYRLYEEKIIPAQLEIFLNDFKTKTFKKSLKNAKISEDDLNHYYNQGKNNSESRFNGFYRDYLDLKIKLYIDNVLNKKSEKIAMKNSNLTDEEYNDNWQTIEEDILCGRMRIIGEYLVNHKSNGAKLANLAGISIEELYSWYFKGKKGEPEFRSFYMMLELGVIYPRIEAYNRAVERGISRNWLHKKLKKDLGAADFRIWEKHGILSEDYHNRFNLEDEDVDGEKIMKLMNNTASTTVIDKDSDPELYDFFKKIFSAIQNHSKSLVDNVKISKKEIMSK
ncbi:hypothetical protein [Methanobrevibacter sp.]